MSDFKTHIERAVVIAGSQQKLADALGCTQQQISYLLQSAKRVSAEMAMKIERATSGQVTMQMLRPDLAALRDEQTTHVVGLVPAPLRELPVIEPCQQVVGLDASDEEAA